MFVPIATAALVGVLIGLALRPLLDAYVNWKRAEFLRRGDVHGAPDEWTSAPHDPIR